MKELAPASLIKLPEAIVNNEMNFNAPPSFKCNKRLTPFTFISIKGHPFTLALELKGNQGLAIPLIKHKYLDPLNLKLEFYSKLKGIIIVHKAFTKFFDAKSHIMI